MRIINPTRIGWASWQFIYTFESFCRKASTKQRGGNGALAARKGYAGSYINAYSSLNCSHRFSFASFSVIFLFKTHILRYARYDVRVRVASTRYGKE